MTSPLEALAVEMDRRAAALDGSSSVWDGNEPGVWREAAEMVRLAASRRQQIAVPVYRDISPTGLRAVEHELRQEVDRLTAANAQVDITAYGDSGRRIHCNACGHVRTEPRVVAE